MKVILEFDYDVDIIEWPNIRAEEVKKHQLVFDKWLYNKNNNHSYWQYENGEKYGVCYRSDAFVEWLNSIVLKNSAEKATILTIGTNDYDKDLPRLKF